jgi:hypothetical protein
VKFAPLTRLYYDNLDDDEDLEAVLAFEKAGTATPGVITPNGDMGLAESYAWSALLVE